MAKVFKAGDNAARILAADLEEFPLREAVHMGSMADGEGVETMSPEALHQMIIAEARAEAEKKIQEAYQTAYQRGLDTGREAFDASIAHAAEALNEAASAMQQARQAFLDSLEPQVVELATLIAERVLQREVRMDPEIIHQTVKRALTTIVDRQCIVVRVHPDDYEALRAHKIRLLEDFDGVKELEVEADDTVSPGGCMIESQLMQTDARLETIFAHVLESLAD
jgi:flagellar assembly protein FliH